MGLKQSIKLQCGSGSVALVTALVVVAFLVINCSARSDRAVPPTVAATKSPADLSSSARYVCKDFISRSGYQAPDFGEWHRWTAVDNKDGTWSVGARFMGAAPGSGVMNLYVTCVMLNRGDNWSLVKLSRLQ